MINYETVNSPFFEENKNYLETILNDFSIYQPKSEGFCNSFGFDVEIKFSKENRQYRLKLKKSQSTQNGNIVPVNAITNFENEIEITNFPSNNTVKISKSSIKRVFMKSWLKDVFSAPYFAEISDENLGTKLSEFVAKYNTEKMELSNRKLSLKTFQKIENHKILEEIESIFYQSLLKT